LEHFLFFDGNARRIAWRIQTNDSAFEQKREHPNIYLNKVTTLQAKYIALHVGLFWGIGRFLIKGGDKITIKIDDRKMVDELLGNEKSFDEFIEKRVRFITQLIDQRKLKINYELVDTEKNSASKLL